MLHDSEFLSQFYKELYDLEQLTYLFLVYPIIQASHTKCSYEVHKIYKLNTPENHNLICLHQLKNEEHNELHLIEVNSHDSLIFL